MSAWQRVAAFLVVAGAVFALALGIGRATGPVDADAEEHAHGTHADDDQGSDVEEHGGDYVLELPRTAYRAGRQHLRFTVRGADGAPVTSYDVAHEKLLHLVVVRHDLARFRHVHPRLDPTSGSWSVPLDLEAGSWRIYADFTPEGGTQTIAEADVSVAGELVPRELPAASDVARTDGYEVHLTREAGMLTFHLTRGHEPVTDLQTYLGAYGHLVAVRADDLAYVHVHPEDGEAGPDIAFHSTLEPGARYRLFLEFRHRGKVHRAELTTLAEEEHDDQHHH
ncbi:MAG TPA: hypothetical protein VNS81_03220 [Nocardioides sp.]|nr:hypothetical protein [Nocardioides sp.]